MPFAPVSTPGTSTAYLQSCQRVDANDKLLFAFIDWLQPHLRLKIANTSARWEDFWRLFKADGTMGWDEFERFLRWDCKLSARKIFDLLDENGSGRISSRTVLEVRRQYERIIDCRHFGLDDLRMVLMRKYGNLVRAWRLLFDPECRGRCSHSWFVKSCKQVGFHGDLKTAWTELTNGEVHRTATVRDLDPAGDQMLLDFYGALRKYHGSARDGWYAVLRAHGISGRMTPDSFETVCIDMKFSKAFGRKLFSLLDLNDDKGVNIDEWEFLALWESRCAEDDDVSPAGPSARLGGSQARPNGGTFNPNASVATTGTAAAAVGGTPPSERSPAKRNAWSLAVPGGGAGSSSVEDRAGGGGAGPNSGAATVEFHVILTKEEHREYLRRRREFDMQASQSPSVSSGRFRPAARGGPSPAGSPTKTREPAEAWMPS